MCHLRCSILQDVPSLAARNSVNFKELENAGLGEEHIPDLMRFSSATILICQSGFVGCHVIEKMRTNGQMTPMQSSIRGKRPEMHAAALAAGTRALALSMSEATSLEYPNEKAAHQRNSLVCLRESATDQDQDNNRTNRHTLPYASANTVQHLHASLSD